MISWYAAAIAPLICWQRQSVPPARLTPVEKQVLAYLCAEQKIKPTCFSFGGESSLLANFQQQLVRLNPKYTLAYLDSVDQAAAGSVLTKPAAFTSAKNRSHCPLEVVFTKQRLVNFLVYEVFPAGDRNFTVSHVYLFALKEQQVRLLHKRALNYN